MSVKKLKAVVSVIVSSALPSNVWLAELTRWQGCHKTPYISTLPPVFLIKLWLLKPGSTSCIQNYPQCSLVQWQNCCNEMSEQHLTSNLTHNRRRVFPGNHCTELTTRLATWTIKYTETKYTKTILTSENWPQIKQKNAKQKKQPAVFL